MKRYLTLVIALVMTITALVGTTSTAFAATDPDRPLRDGELGFTVKDLIETGKLNGPESSGWLDFKYVKDQDGSGHYEVDKESIYWTLKDGTLIIYNNRFDPNVKYTSGPKISGLNYLDNPLAQNPYIETVIVVGGYLHGFNLHYCENLNTLMIINGAVQNAYWAVDTNTYTHLYADTSALYYRTERILGNVSMTDDNGLHMVAWDFTGKNTRHFSDYTGRLSCDIDGNIGSPHTTPEGNAKYKANFDGIVYTDKTEYKAYVQSVIDSGIALNEEARALLAQYGYDMSKASGKRPTDLYKTPYEQFQELYPDINLTEEEYNAFVEEALKGESSTSLGTGSSGTIVGMGSGTEAPAAQSGFKVSDWAADYVNKAFDMGIGNQFSVRDCTVAITRKQFAQLAMDTVMRTGGILPAVGASPFTDTDDLAVTMAYEMGIISGYGGGKFGPDDLITREQAATMLSRLAEAMGKPMTAKVAPFTDSISDWAKAGVECCYGSGIMSGVGNNLFGASGSYTVEQSLVTMVRIADYLAN